MGHSPRAEQIIGTPVVAAIFSAALLTGCVSTTVPQTQQVASKPSAPAMSLAQAQAKLAPVKARVEPVAERECRARTNSSTNCDYNIFVDSDLNKAANAYQTVDKNGRPLLVFTASLIAETRNTDELAFVMGHEAAHHVAGHLTQTQNDAVTGAILGAVLMSVVGGNAAAVEAAMDLGGTVGARSFSKSYELEADALGTVIAHKAGYNPVRGAEFFNRIADPGDQFLGTHPPNKSRMETVRRTAAGL